MIVHDDIINQSITPPPYKLRLPVGIFEYSHEIRLTAQIILFLIPFLASSDFLVFPPLVPP